MNNTQKAYSTFHVLEGQHDFNKVPFGPPGTSATVFNPPETRGSFGPSTLDGWYVPGAPPPPTTINVPPTYQMPQQQTGGGEFIPTTIVSARGGAPTTTKGVKTEGETEETAGM